MSSFPTPASMPTDNADQIAFWNGAGGEKWLRSTERLERGLGPLGRAAIDVAAPRPGEHVLDVGCGGGPTALLLAERVGPQGAVLGVDVSQPLIGVAQQRAAKLGNVKFVVADASAHRFEPTFDLLFSRFGVMFFADPPGAFANLRRALKPGGRLTFVCWRSFKENGWAFVPFMAAVPHLPPIERPAPNAPGPFAFADGDRLAGILTQAGFADVAIDPLDRTIDTGATLDEAVTFASEVGPVSRVLGEAAPEPRQKAVAAIRETLTRLAEGAAPRLAAACWIATARNPG